jgi:hypothetical protein
MTGIIHALEVGVVAMLVLFIAYLVEFAREKGVLMESLVVSFLALVTIAIVASVVWFNLHIPAGLHRSEVSQSIGVAGL